MKRIKQLVVVLGIVGGLSLAAAPVQVGAVNAFGTCTSSTESDVCASTGDNVNTYIKTIVNVLLFIVGLVSVIVIIIGAFQYVTSMGDSSKLASAKNTILYAVIGLVIAVLAYAIVNFVVGTVNSAGTTTTKTKTK